MKTLILTALTAAISGLIVATPSQASLPGPVPFSQVIMYPIYVPADLVQYEVPCGGGTHLLSFDYFPQPGDTTYELHLMAEGGTYGGSVTLSLPWGYEDSAYVPALSGAEPYTVTVQTPPYTGTSPVRVFVYGTGEVCQRQKHDERATVTPLMVHALNIKAGH